MIRACQDKALKRTEAVNTDFMIGFTASVLCYARGQFFLTVQIETIITIFLSKIFPADRIS